MPIYADAGNSILMSNYVSTATLLTNTASNSPTGGTLYSNGSTMSNGNYQYSPFRINVDFTTAYTFSRFDYNYKAGSTNVQTYIYGSNSSVSYSDTVYNDRTTDTNLVLLVSALIVSSQTISLYSTDTTNTYRYLHIFHSNASSGVQFKCDSMKHYTGTITKTNLINNTDYTIASDSTSGYPMITNLKSTNIQGYYNGLALHFNELHRRIYPTIRDKNTITNTDGTNTATLTSTVGYPISKASDCT